MSLSGEELRVQLFTLFTILYMQTLLDCCILQWKFIWLILLSPHFQICENENKEELKAKLKEILREKNDIFNSKNQEEDKVWFALY